MWPWSGLARTEQLCLLHTIFTGQPLLHRNPDVVTQPVLAQSLEHLGPADQHHHPHVLALQATFSMFLKLEKRSSKFKINEKFTICMEQNNIKYRNYVGRLCMLDPSPNTYPGTLNFDKLHNCCQQIFPPNFLRLRCAT